MIDHKKILDKTTLEFGSGTRLETLVDLKPVSNDETHPFIQLVYDVCGVSKTDIGYPKTLPYLTDGSVLQRVFNMAPTIVLGPGQPEMAHQTDEFCYIQKLEQSVDIYKDIILKWGNSQ
jgi:succinyl-diaminopimelate desuccinylase